MSNLLTIAQGWYNYINSTPKIKRLMDRRLAVCNGCEEIRETSPAVRSATKLLTNTTVMHYCNKCKCPLGPKLSSPNESCPLKYWQAEPVNSNFY